MADGSLAPAGSPAIVPSVGDPAGEDVHYYFPVEIEVIETARDSDDEAVSSQLQQLAAHLG
jgi:hypothetical protein